MKISLAWYKSLTLVQSLHALSTIESGCTYKIHFLKLASSKFAHVHVDIVGPLLALK